jgi:hypothetical protein
MQLASSAGYTCKSDVRAVPKMVREFLKACGRQIQVNCCCPPDCGSSHWKAKMGWLTGANWMQRNGSFKSEHEKQIAFSGIKTNKCTDLEPLGAKSLLLECLDHALGGSHWCLASGLTIREYSRQIGKVLRFHSLRVSFSFSFFF